MKRRNVYIAGPMRGRPEFNFPAFFKAEAHLQTHGWNTFNPARRDNEAHGADISSGNLTGDEDQATKEHGFNLREALAADMDWICRYADAVYLLRGWETSLGAVAERALADALSLDIYYE